MTSPRLRARYRRIVAFELSVVLQVWWFNLVLPRLGLRAWSQRGQAQRLVRTARRFRHLATDLGGLMIKVGQFMSTRIDMLPTEVTDELAALQDAVPAADFSEVRQLAETELGMPLDRAFSSFDTEPIAAASLGQAYRATLYPADATETGYAEVVVKVQRPGIAEVVEVDLAALRRIAGWLARLTFISERADVPALIEEFALTSHEEIDYLHEASEAERFRREFAPDLDTAPHGAANEVEITPGSILSCAPRIAWERSTRRVLTLEDVSAIKISDTAALQDAGISPHQIAEALAFSMFTQLFVTGHFHADPHPGNIFVTPHAARRSGTDKNTRGFSLTFIDFGMTGTIDDDMRAGLRDVVIAVGLRSGPGMIAAFERLGVLLPSADSTVLSEAMVELFDRFGGMAVTDLQQVDPQEFEEFAHRFRDLIRSMPFQLPENFLLIMRAVSMLSGLCLTLDPTFNIWQSAEPFAKKLLREQAGSSAKEFAQRAVQAATTTAQVVTRLPGRLDHVIGVVEAGDLSVNTPQIEHQLKRLERTAVRIIAAIIFLGLVISGAVLRDGAGAAVTVGVVMMSASALPLLYAFFGGRKVR